MNPTTDHRPTMTRLDAAGRGRGAVARVLYRVVAWSIAILAMVGVFMAYLDPQLMVTLGNAVWSCL